MLYADSAPAADLGYVVMDEVHYLADRFRGAVWEEVIIHLPSEVQVASLSATVSNAEEFGAWLDTVRGDTDVIVSEHRPVPLWQHVHGGPARSWTCSPATRLRRDRPAGGAEPRPARPPPRRGRRTGARAAVRGQPRAARHGPRESQLNFRAARPRRPERPAPAQPARRRRPAARQPVRKASRPRSSPASTGRTCCRPSPSSSPAPAATRPWRQCVRRRAAATTEQERARSSRDRVDEAGAGHPRPTTWTCWASGAGATGCSRGIAAHHAGHAARLQGSRRGALRDGLVKAVFATETLALGVNMPARTVVLEKLEKFNGEAHVTSRRGSTPS